MHLAELGVFVARDLLVKPQEQSNEIVTPPSKQRPAERLPRHSFSAQIPGLKKKGPTGKWREWVLLWWPTKRPRPSEFGRSKV